MSETPSAAILRDAARELTAIDAAGRKITFRRLSAFDQMQLAKLLGPDGAKNDIYYGFALYGYSVTDIDGVPKPIASSEQQILAVVKELDEVGIDALVEARKKARVNGPRPDLDAAKN